MEVPESFIEDQFNLTGLNGQVPFYSEALAMILDGEYGTSPDLVIVRRVLTRAIAPFIVKILSFALYPLL